MQFLRAPTSIGGQNARQIVNPNTGNGYTLDGQGRLLAAEADAAWLLSQGFSPAANIVSDLFTAAGVIASGTSSVGLGLLPASMYIEGLIFQNLNANAITGGVNVGSSVGAADIVSALAVAGNALIVVADALILKRAFSAVAPTSLFVSAGGSWNGASLNMLGSHRRRPNRTRSIKQKDRPKVVENLSEFKRAETKIPSDDVRRRRRRNERKRRVWKLLPDRKIFRGDSEPSESQHVSARFSHSSGLCPCDLIDGQSFPLRL